jgi:HAD superfamily hydrolase (TIGR01548 family)
MKNDTKLKGLIAFDMDGVLVDVSGSYRETVRHAARYFWRGARGWDDLPDPLFPLSDLARVKQGGGLNNDWDLTFVVINLLFTRVKGETAPPEGVDKWSAYRAAMRRLDVSILARYLATEENPLTRLLEENGRPRCEFAAALYAGDVGSGNVVKQIFQEIYLGESLFESTYGTEARVYKGRGYIERERLLIDPAILEALSGDYHLAVATGRPKIEAWHALDRFGIGRFFSPVLTLDDCLAEEGRIYRKEGKKVTLSKPDPYMLVAVRRFFATDFPRLLYIGDMPDDMAAAANAGFEGIGILISAIDKDRLREDLLRGGACRIIDDFEGLPGVLRN